MLEDISSLSLYSSTPKSMLEMSCTICECVACLSFPFVFFSLQKPHNNYISNNCDHFFPQSYPRMWWNPGEMLCAIESCSLWKKGERLPVRLTERVLRVEGDRPGLTPLLFLVNKACLGWSAFEDRDLVISQQTALCIELSPVWPMYRQCLALNITKVPREKKRPMTSIFLDGNTLLMRENGQTGWR